MGEDGVKGGRRDPTSFFFSSTWHNKSISQDPFSAIDRLDTAVSDDVAFSILSGPACSEK